MSRQSITKWETGTAFPELKKLLQVSVTLDKDLDWLLCDERNALITNGARDQLSWQEDQQIFDVNSLKEAVREHRIRRILECLDGTEFTVHVEEEDFAGDRAYMVFGLKMYVSSKGMNPITGEPVEEFTEVKPEKAVEMLLQYGV